MKKLLLFVIILILVAVTFFVLKEFYFGNICPKGQVSIDNGRCARTGVVLEGLQ